MKTKSYTLDLTIEQARELRLAIHQRASKVWESNLSGHPSATPARVVMVDDLVDYISDVVR